MNMITCGGQATIPMVAAVSRVTPVPYAEIVSTVASRSAGPGTRANIDEFTETTAHGLVTIGGAAQRQGDHHPQPGRAADPDAQHRLLRAAGATPTTTRSRRRSRRWPPRSRRYVPGYRVKGCVVR